MQPILTDKSKRINHKSYIHLALLNFSIEAGNLLCGNGALRAMVVGAFARVCGIDVDRLGALSVGAYLVSPTTP